MSNININFNLFDFIKLSFYSLKFSFKNGKINLNNKLKYFLLFGNM